METIKVEVEQYEKIESSLFVINIWVNGGSPFKLQSKTKLSEDRLKALELYVRKHIDKMLGDIISLKF